jgi:hypothetical protein
MKLILTFPRALQPTNGGDGVVIVVVVTATV